MSDENMNDTAAGDDIARILELASDIEAEKKKLKQRTPKSLDDVHQILLGTVLPLMQEIAHWQGELAKLTAETADRVDDMGAELAPSEETQFLFDDAKKFELVVSYAAGVAKASLEQMLQERGSDVEGTPEYQKTAEVLAKANECLKLIEEGTLEEDDDEDSAADEGSGAIN